MINSKGDRYENSDRRTATAVLHRSSRKIRDLRAAYAFYDQWGKFYEGVNLTHEEFFRQMEEGADITTSQPSPGEVTDFWDKLLKEYDEILYIPMSGGLSGSCQTAIMLSDDYDGKVQVVNNQRISVTQEQSALDARDLAAKGYEAAQIKEILERVKYESSIYVTPY